MIFYTSPSSAGLGLCHSVPGYPPPPAPAWGFPDELCPGWGELFPLQVRLPAPSRLGSSPGTDAGMSDRKRQICVSLSLLPMATLGPSHVLMLEVTPDRRLSNTDPPCRPRLPKAHGRSFSWTGCASASAGEGISPSLSPGFWTSPAAGEAGFIPHRTRPSAAPVFL